MICWPYIKLGSLLQVICSSSEYIDDILAYIKLSSVLQVICSSSEYIDDMLPLYQAGFSTMANMFFL